MFPVDCKIDVYFHGNIPRGLYVWEGDYLIKRAHHSCQDEVALRIPADVVNKSTSATQCSKPALHSGGVQREAAPFTWVCFSLTSSTKVNSGMIGDNRKRYYFWVKPIETQTLALITHTFSHWKTIKINKKTTRSICLTLILIKLSSQYWQPELHVCRARPLL